MHGSFCFGFNFILTLKEFDIYLFYLSIIMVVYNNIILTYYYYFHSQGILYMMCFYIYISLYLYMTSTIRYLIDLCWSGLVVHHETMSRREGRGGDESDHSFCIPTSTKYRHSSCCLSYLKSNNCRLFIHITGIK